MKGVSIITVVVLILCIALPGSIQGRGKKSKPKFCVGKDGQNYKKGEYYEDKEACVRFTCVKKGKTLKMDKNDIPCGSTLSPEIETESILAANVTALETKFQTIQTSMESVLEIVATLQSSSSKQGSCLADITSSSCPSPVSGKTTMAGGISANTADLANKCDTSTCSALQPKEVYFIGCGSVIELYHPTIENLKCAITPPSFSSLNKRFNGHTSFYHSNSLYLCGGSVKEASTCISYNSNTKKWKTHALSISRFYGHTSVALKNSLYLIGGVDASRDFVDAVSTPLPLTNQSIFTPIPNLDFKKTYPCTTKIDDDTFVIIGGTDSNTYYDTVIQYSTKTGNATSLPSLATGRYQHGCVMAEINNKKWLIVSGGVNYRLAKDEHYLQSTEMLELGGGSWVSLGDINVPRRAFSLISTERGVMAIAGYDQVYGGNALKSVELLDWTTKKWKVVQPSTHHTFFHYGGAIAIPASMFDCPV